MKFNLRSLADAGKRAPSPRTRWCSYCKRNEHHLCSGMRRVNHGRTVPCECPQGDRHDPNRRLALNRPPPISLLLAEAHEHFAASYFVKNEM